MTAKIFRNAFLIGFTVLLACILLFFFIMYSNYQAQAFDNLAIEAEHISEGMQICGGESYLSAVQSGERITWIAADGSVLYDNMADSSTMENHLQRPEVAEAFETGSGRSDRYSSTILEKNNYYALLLKDGTVLRVAGKQTSLAAMALMLVQPSLWIVVLVLVLCGLLAMRLAKQIVRPINAINPDNPNATPTYPELQPLISRLQEQNRTIRTQLSELSTRQREFDAITENMREGFLIVDNKCSILSSNRSALRLLGIDDAHFRSGFMAMDGDVNLMKAIEDGLYTRTTKERLEALEIQKDELTAKIADEKLKKPCFNEDFIRFWLMKFRKFDISQKKQRKALIEIFVNAIFLYDDRMLITFNYKDGTQTVRFEDALTADSAEEKSSDLSSSAGPFKSSDFTLEIVGFFSFTG